MNVDEAVAALSSNDKRILKCLSDNSKYAGDIALEIQLDKASVLSSSRKLLEFGLVTINNEVSMVYTLTDIGRGYLSTGLPELIITRKLVEKGNVSLSDASKLGLEKEELNASIGLLRKQGIVELKAGTLIYAGKGAENIESKSRLLLEINHGEVPADTESINEFLRRKLIVANENIKESLKITSLGTSVLRSKEFDKEVVDKLTSDIIKNWKGIAFRRYSLNARIPTPVYGKKHITKQFIKMLRENLTAMGFEEMQSNYAEASFWNFDVMLFKQDHPDRDIQDTVYLDGRVNNLPPELLSKVKNVYENGFKRNSKDFSVGYRMPFDEKKSRVLIMRAHTTATTFRYFYDKISKNKDKPARYFSISKVFRNETLDPTHLPEFYQIEGIVYDDGLTVSDLKSYITEFYKRMGIDKIRIKPTYNPYTEPSLEIQAFSPKLNRWLEVGNSGMFRPETLEPFGIKKNIIAWGFALERPLSLLLATNDLRLIYGAFSDLDLLREIEYARLSRKL